MIRATIKSHGVGGMPITLDKDILYEDCAKGPKGTIYIKGCDPENLRESYIKKQIFNIGDRVENLNTGLIGRIIRRGANHLICVAENNIMFKSWVKDLREAIVNATTPSGVPANQRLVGTDAHRKYVETMVPGSSYGLQFINKYKKRK